MERIEIGNARLELPRLLNDVDLAPEDAVPAVNFDLGSAVLQRNGLSTIALGLSPAGKQETFACLFLTPKAAKTLAEKLLEVSA